MSLLHLHHLRSLLPLTLSHPPTIFPRSHTSSLTRTGFAGNVTKISSGLAHWAQTCMNRLDSLDASLRRSAKRVGTLKRGRAGPPQQLLESPTLGLHVSTHASSAGVGNFYHSSRGGVDGGAAGQHTFSRTRSNGSNSSRTSSNASIVSRGRRKGAENSPPPSPSSSS